MNAAELLQIKESWINTMKEKQLEMVQPDPARNAKPS